MKTNNIIFYYIRIDYQCYFFCVCYFVKFRVFDNWNTMELIVQIMQFFPFFESMIVAFIDSI